QSRSTRRWRDARPPGPRMPARTPRPWARATAAPSAAPRARAALPARRSPDARAVAALRSRAGRRRGLVPGRAPALPRLHPVFERVDERLPGGLDDVLRDADRAPHLIAVGCVEQHPGHGARALGLVEDPHLEVDQV